MGKPESTARPFKRGDEVALLHTRIGDTRRIHFILPITWSGQGELRVRGPRPQVGDAPVWRFDPAGKGLGNLFVLRHATDEDRAHLADQKEWETLRASIDKALKGLDDFPTAKLRALAAVLEGRSDATFETTGDRR